MKALAETQEPTVSTYLAVITKAASDPNVDVSKMEKLLDMQERVIKYNAQVQFAADFAEMQAALPVITEYGAIKVNGQVRSTYATFEDINEEIKPILQRFGFSVFFNVKAIESKATVQGILMHRLGHRETTELTLDADTSGSKNSVQAMGSSLSYAKRYVLCALLNITTRGEDDDGDKGGKTVASCWKGPQERKRFSTELQRAWGKGDTTGFVEMWDALELDQKKDVWTDFNSTQRSEMKEMISSARKGEAAQPDLNLEQE